MQRTVLATLLALGLGVFGVSVAQATPAGGLAIGKAATQTSSTEMVQRRRRRRMRRRRRRCWVSHRWRSRRVRVCN